MILSSTVDLDIIKYEYDNNNRLIIECKCCKCDNNIKQHIHLDKITNIYCKKCKKIVCVIPLEISEKSGKLVDFVIVTYYNVNKILKLKQVQDKLNKESDKESKDRLQLKIIKEYLRDNHVKKNKLD